MAAQLNQANFRQAQQAGEFDVSAANQMGQFNASQRIRSAWTIMAAGQQHGPVQRRPGQQYGSVQCQRANNMAQFNATQQNQVGLANMAAANAMGQFNAGALKLRRSPTRRRSRTRATSIYRRRAGSGALGNQAQLSQARNFTEQMTAGQMQQQQAQNQINAQMAKFQNATNYPNQQLSVLQSALGMTPYEQGQQGSSTTQTQTAANPLQMALGGLSTLGSLFSAPAGGTSAWQRPRRPRRRL